MTEPSAAVAPTLLIVRPRDLVVLAVRWTGCDVRTSAGVPVLVASGSSPTVTLTFPPQALLEQTTTQSGFYTESNVYSQSRLSGVSELVFRVTPGATIKLTAAGILQALGKVDPSSAVEMPWGLRLQPLPQTTGADVLSNHAANLVPLAGSDVVGLWQARLRAADGSAIDARLAVSPQMVPGDHGISPGEMFDLPPLHGWRPTIATNGSAKPPRATRLELSALGGSLSCAATWRDSSWSHEIRLGRDRNVQVTALGRLWPFGHRVAYQVFIRRAFLPVRSAEREGTVAALHARHVLVILERTRTRQRAPTFPFDDVEVLGQEFLLSGAPVDPHMFIPEANGVLRIPVRCRSGTTDVRVAIPVIFAGDDRQPTTALLSAWRAHARVTIPGVALDMIGAGGQPGDIHEVRSLTFDGVPDGATFRPKLDQFQVVLQALRSLLPGGGHDTNRTLKYASGLRADAIPRVPLVFDETSLVDVNFTKNTDRSGGLVAPRFTANGIARDLGPVATSVLDPPDLSQALASAFADATLFGFPLAALVDTAHISAAEGIKAAPTIIQKRVGATNQVELYWKLILKADGPFQRLPDATAPPPQLDLTVTSNPEMLAAPDSPSCKLSNFMLALPPASRLMTIAFKEVRFVQRPKEPMKLEVKGLDIQFVGALQLLQELQKRVTALLGDTGPTVSVSTTEIVVSYVLRIPDAPAGMFVMRNIAVRTEVHVPFATDPVRVVVGFASREQPFGLTVSGFGGGGYVALEIAGDKPSRLELSLEFGAMVALDFVVAKAEVHAFGGVRFVREASGLTMMEAFIRIGGSAQLLGLITISIELRVALTFVHNPPEEPRLTGRASIVIELDLTLYSETVTVDSGTYELIGGSSPLGPSLDAGTSEAARQDAWESYWKAFA